MSTELAKAPGQRSQGVRSRYHDKEDEAVSKKQENNPSFIGSKDSKKLQKKLTLSPLTPLGHLEGKRKISIDERIPMNPRDHGRKEEPKRGSKDGVNSPRSADSGFSNRWSLKHPSESSLSREFGSEGDKSRSKSSSSSNSVAGRRMGFNSEVCQVLLTPDIFEHIMNPLTREYLKLKEGTLNPPKGKLDPLENSPNKAQASSPTKPKIKEFRRLSNENRVDTLEKLNRLEVEQMETSKDKEPKMQKMNKSTKPPEELKLRPKARLSNVEEAYGDNAYTKAKTMGLKPWIPKPARKKGPKLTKAMINHLNDYVPIALFLTITHGMVELAQKLLWYDRKLHDRVSEMSLEEILHHENFMIDLFQAILKHGENRMFQDVLLTVKNWDLMFSPSILELFVEMKKASYLTDFLMAFNSFLQTNKAGKPMTLSPQKAAVAEASQEAVSVMTEDKIVKVIKIYFENSDDNNLILEILRNMKLSSQKILELVSRTQEEDRFIAIVRSNPELKKWLDPKLIIEHKLYKALMMLDRMTLVNVMNTPIKSESSSHTLFQEICDLIKKGERIQSLCFLVMHVSDNFWDLEKLFKFYSSINEVLRYESKNNWLLYVHNPLLFYVKLIHFFKDKEVDLDARSKDITTLCEDLVQFCLNYFDFSNDESLIINVLDHDKYNIEFLEYAFLTEEKKLVEVDFIESLIYQMWDLGRHSLQTLVQHMRLSNMMSEIQKFSFKVFWKDFEIPKDPHDRFQLEFLYTSNSVYLRVLSGILWPLTIFGMEVNFAFQIINAFKEGTFDSSFLWDYYTKYPVLSWIQIYLRANHIINMVVKSLALGDSGKQWLYLKYFYKVILFLYFNQMVIYPLFLSDEFWYLNYSQLILVTSNICYCLYYSLALSYVGLIFRIFLRMLMVVFVYGTVSCLLMSLIAYPLHSAFLEWSQIPNDPYPKTELNLFKNYFIGDMTLFEFIFGAVVFNRPYTKLDGYALIYTYIMIVFSFFGNIMLANLMVAFLASQFEMIMKKAKYFTQQMQYGLIKVFRVSDLDSVFTLPYILTLPMVPIFIWMGLSERMRPKLNLMLQKLIHIINVFLPTFIIMYFYLLVLACKRYLDVFLLILSNLKSISSLIYLIVWMLVGPLLQIKLHTLDMITVTRVLLTFDTSNKSDILNFALTKTEKEKLIKIFSGIKKVAEFLLNEKKIRKISLKGFLFEMGVFYSKDKTMMKEDRESKEKEKEKEKEKDQNENKLETSDLSLEGVENQAQTKESKQARTTRLTSLFKAKYGLEDRKLYPLILKKYISRADKIEAEDNSTQMTLDLKFMLRKFNRQIAEDSIHRLISFDRQSLELARSMMQDTGDADLKTEIKNLKKQIESISENVALLMKYLSKLNFQPLEGKL